MCARADSAHRIEYAFRHGGRPFDQAPRVLIGEDLRRQRGVQRMAGAMRHDVADDGMAHQRQIADHIAGARTFGFLKEVEWLRQNGLALGGSLENAIVIGDTNVLNALRFEDEFVRHKILDVVGDLALVGYPIVGHVVAHRAGHALHTALAAEILADQDAWCLVDAPAAVPESVFDTVGAVGVRAH